MITLTYDGVKYELEYTRRTVAALERAGFRVSEIGEMPASSVMTLVEGAFLANHRNVKPQLVERIYSHIPRKSEFLSKLIEMYNDTLAPLLSDPEDDEGNAEWTAD